MHCQALEEIRVFIVEVHGLAQPYLQLAAAKYRINIGEHFDNLTKVWEYLRNKEAFAQYIKSEVEKYLKEL